MDKTIYELELHECINLKQGETALPANVVMRVPGGWLYGLWDYQKNYYSIAPTFVPFDNEFKWRGK